MNDLQYWKKRCKRVEDRNDQLMNEIAMLKGGKPLTVEYIKKLNKENGFEEQTI